jgi:hypothetical protein
VTSIQVLLIITTAAAVIDAIINDVDGDWEEHKRI